MRKCLLLIFLGIVIISESKAQFSRYVIKLRNKGGNTFSLSSPNAYLSQRAIDRRVRYGIPLDSTDLPVTVSYVTQIRNVPNVTVLNVSKWLNSVTIQTTDPNALTTINGFSFVQSVSGIAARGLNTESPAIDKFRHEQIISELPFQTYARATANYFNYGTNSFNEIHLHNGEFLHNIGLRGQSMHIAMLDAGFFNYTTLDAMDSIIANGQVLSTWDFVARNASVVEDNSHGMQCLSTIAANIPGQFIGKAPKASFHLFRTEDVGSEYPIEEHNWVCGAERADSAGSDVISSSLGYFDFDNSSFDYTYSNMNGNTTISVTGADLAAKKGLLVFNAVGNEGSSSWHYLITPSDGDSVVAVGAVNSLGTVGGFSSYGPSSDGQIKPDVASVGVAAMVQTPSNTVGFNNGTSFACPNMAGLATCLWQGFPEFSNMRIVRALQQAGSIAAAPNDRIGYGIPDMKKAFSSLLIEYATSSITLNGCSGVLSWNSKDMQDMKYEIERKTSTDLDYIKIGELNPQPGNVLANRSYQFSNNVVNAAFGIISYRIRQIVDTASANFTAVYIDTASFNYSGCAAIINPNPGSDFILVYPNPGAGPVTLLVETTDAVPNMAVRVYDMKGSLVIHMDQSKTPGRVQFDLPVSRLASGEYIIRVSGGGRTIGSTQLIKL